MWEVRTKFIIWWTTGKESWLLWFHIRGRWQGQLHKLPQETDRPCEGWGIDRLRQHPLERLCRGASWCTTPKVREVLQGLRVGTQQGPCCWPQDRDLHAPSWWWDHSLPSDQMICHTKRRGFIVRLYIFLYSFTFVLVCAFEWTVSQGISKKTMF